jgi:hypothetical protein
MPVSLPYLQSNKNLATLFQKIQSAKIPDKFNRDFLHTTIGLKGSNDRSYIPFLRTLGFIDQSGTPTPQYRLLKSDDSAKAAIAQAIRTAYGPLFEADEKANALSSDKLKGLVAQVAGTDDDMTGRIVSTFSSMTKLADFQAEPKHLKPREDEKEKAKGEHEEEKVRVKEAGSKGLRPEFHYNIQIHLPSNATEEVYLTIFNALRKVFQ